MEEINLGDSTNLQIKSNSNKKVIGIVICAITLIMVFVIILASTPTTKTYLTYNNYKKIQTGMTYNEVVEILENHPGSLDTSSSYGGYTLAYYTWANNDRTRCIIVGFENGKVCSKSQYGLN
jgi:hypothetical protein